MANEAIVETEIHLFNHLSNDKKFFKRMATTYKKQQLLVSGII
jgi:hypothetical protein